MESVFEVAQAAMVRWHRVSQCANSTCVEVARVEDGVAVRDSKDPESVLVFDREEWQAFVEGVKAGEFDL